ncbi:hypothetical protein [Pseudooceanicola onchidii]|uniref:hypothetical protein n=1 Tax=Pseudooceanicola onchidii TaxID=2562279 RepID=UPI00145BDB59|nr:hypothetical protein [Pseudooceanicola onchidii]
MSIQTTPLTPSAPQPNAQPMPSAPQAAQIDWRQIDFAADCLIVRSAPTSND